MKIASVGFTAVATAILLSGAAMASSPVSRLIGQFFLDTGKRIFGLGVGGGLIAIGQNKPSTGQAEAATITAVYLEVPRGQPGIDPKIEACLLSSPRLGECRPCSLDRQLKNCSPYFDVPSLIAYCDASPCNPSRVQDNIKKSGQAATRITFASSQPVLPIEPIKQVAESKQSLFPVVVVYFKNDGQQEDPRVKKLAEDIASTLRPQGANISIVHSDFAELGTDVIPSHTIRVICDAGNGDRLKTVRETLQTKFKDLAFEVRRKSKATSAMQILVPAF